MKMKMKDLVMLGIIVGIACFFIGAMILKVFPSSETDLLSYKVSACVKLFGVGVLISSMVVGGILLEEIDKNLRILLLLLGLILLLVYTVGSQSLEWYVPTSQSVTGNQSYEYRPTGYGIPGFECVSVLGALVFLFFWKKQKKK
jgi:membrane protease YdiL (CAAX protease family)